jgi:hypothetical protein
LTTQGNRLAAPVQVLNRVAIGWLAGHCYLLDSLNVKVLDLSMAVGFTIRQLDTPEELDVYRGKGDCAKRC